jgi:hypothetical protein
MFAVLKHRLNRQDIEAANSDVIATLNSYDRSAAPPFCPAGMQLNAGRCQMSPMAGGWCPPPMWREGLAFRSHCSSRSSRRHRIDHGRGPCVHVRGRMMGLFAAAHESGCGASRQFTALHYSTVFRC